MKKSLNEIKKDLKEQNAFLKHVCQSLEDLKHGRVEEMKLPK